MNNDDDRIVQFVFPVEPEDLDLEDLQPSPEPEPEPEPEPYDELTMALLGIPIVHRGDILTCRKCGRVWKSRRGGLRPCPGCTDKEWWKEFALEDLEVIEARQAGQSTALQPSPSTGKVHCRLALEVYEPAGPGGASPSAVGVYKKVGAGWPRGGGLGVVKFRVDGQEELEELMKFVKDVVNGHGHVGHS